MQKSLNILFMHYVEHLYINEKNITTLEYIAEL